MATSSSVILLIVAGSFLGAAYGGDKLHVPPAQDINSFTFQLRTIYMKLISEQWKPPHQSDWRW